MAYDSADFKGPNGVNVAEILRVADAVERSASFDMSDWALPCGTPSCIAGHLVGDAVIAVVNSMDRNNDNARIDYMLGVAAPMLGIKKEAARVLFMPWCKHGNICSLNIQSDWASACLRNLAETGEVDWLGTKPAPASPASGG